MHPDFVAFIIVHNCLVVPASFYEGDQYAIEAALALHRANPCLPCVVIAKCGRKLPIRTGDTAHFVRSCGRCQPCRLQRGVS